ncbi:MAG: hypothetical protein ACXU95_12235, partial [Isosphaeraceae bacterium]
FTPRRTPGQGEPISRVWESTVSGCVERVERDVHVIRDTVPQSRCAAPEAAGGPSRGETSIPLANEEGRPGAHWCWFDVEVTGEDVTSLELADGDRVQCLDEQTRRLQSRLPTRSLVSLSGRRTRVFVVASFGETRHIGLRNIGVFRHFRSATGPT